MQLNDWLPSAETVKQKDKEAAELKSGEDGMVEERLKHSLVKGIDEFIVKIQKKPEPKIFKTARYN